MRKRLGRLRRNLSAAAALTPELRSRVAIWSYSNTSVIPFGALMARSSAESTMSGICGNLRFGLRPHPGLGWFVQFGSMAALSDHLCLKAIKAYHVPSRASAKSRHLQRGFEDGRIRSNEGGATQVYSNT